MTGFDVDPVALRAAVNELRGQHDKLVLLSERGRDGIAANELVAADASTKHAREAIEKKSGAATDSVSHSADELAKLLEEKIGAYEATLKQYETDDEAAAAEAARLAAQA